MELTLENLSRKYNLGIKLDESERFYTGKNREEMRLKFVQSGMKNKCSFFAKEIKRIVKEEFGITIKARATHYKRIDVIIEKTKDELFKNFEELTKDERQELYCCMRLHCEELNGISEETARLYYENIQKNRVVNSEFLKDENKLLEDFIELLMESWNYDHTGAFMGDCDYDDADFYGFVFFEATDQLACCCDTKFGMLYNLILAAKNDDELREIIKSNI